MGKKSKNADGEHPESPAAYSAGKGKSLRQETYDSASAGDSLSSCSNGRGVEKTQTSPRAGRRGVRKRKPKEASVSTMGLFPSDHSIGSRTMRMMEQSMRLRRKKADKVNWGRIRQQDKTARISTDQAAEFLRKRRRKSRYRKRQENRFIRQLKALLLKIQRLFAHHTSVESKINHSDETKTAGKIMQDSELLGAVPSLDSIIKIGDKFAEGGQGTLYTATDLSLNRTVAVKSLKKEFLDDEEQRNHFIAEAKVTAQLDHPSIVPIYMLTTDENRGLHLSMKKLQGVTLQRYLEQVSQCYSIDGVDAYDESKSIRYRLDLLLRVCDAMSYAHSRNVLHCDLKPENIMIGEYHEAYVMDWGIAHPIRSAEYDPKTWVRPKTISGTPRFLAPEVIAGDLPDERADVFALGLILFETVTLRPAFSGQDNEDIMRKILYGDMAPVVHLYHAKIDRDLEAIIHKACATRCDQRYRNAAELADDLRRYLNGIETIANPDSLASRIFRFFWRHRTAAWRMLQLILLGVVAVVCWTLYQQENAARSAFVREYALSSALEECRSWAVHLDQDIRTAETLLWRAGSKIAGKMRQPKQNVLTPPDASEANGPGWEDEEQYRTAVERWEARLRNPEKNQELFASEELQELKSIHFLQGFVRSSYYCHPVNFNALSYSVLSEGSESEECIQESLREAERAIPLLREIVLAGTVANRDRFESQQDFLTQKALSQGMPVQRVLLAFEDRFIARYPAEVHPLKDERLISEPWFRTGLAMTGFRKPVWMIQSLEAKDENAGKVP